MKILKDPPSNCVNILGDLNVATRPSLLSRFVIVLGGTEQHHSIGSRLVEIEKK